MLIHCMHACFSAHTQIARLARTSKMSTYPRGSMYMRQRVCPVRRGAHMRSHARTATEQSVTWLYRTHLGATASATRCMHMLWLHYPALTRVPKLASC